MKRLKYVYLVAYVYKQGNTSGTGSIVIRRTYKIDDEEQLRLTEKYICEDMDNDVVTITNFILLNKRGR